LLEAKFEVVWEGRARERGHKLSSLLSVGIAAALKKKKSKPAGGLVCGLT